MNNGLRNVILEASVGRALLALMIPMTLGNFLQAGYQLTDAYWVGRLGASAVAAVAVSFPITFLIITLGSGIAMAGTVLVAHHAGAGRAEMVDHVAGQTMVMVLLTSIVLGATGYCLAPSLLRLLGVAPEVQAGALGFMRVSALGTVFVFCYIMFQALMRGIGRTRLPTLIVVGTVFLNFALDPLFIFGLSSVRGAGVVGAAVATMVTQGLAAGVGILILINGRNGIHLRWNNLRPDLAYIRTAFMLGLPGSIDLSARALSNIVMAFLVAGFGTVPIAVYGVGSTITQIVTISAAGMSMALTTLVGQNLGAINEARTAQIARSGIVYGFAASAALGIVAFAAAPEIVSFFINSDPEVTAGGAKFIRIMALTWGGIGIQFCAVAVLRASGRFGQAMAIALISQWVIQLPLADLRPETSSKFW